MRYLSPSFNWTGSKYKMLNKIIPILNGVSHKRFVDVFGGSGVVTLNVEPVKNEIFNDGDSLIVNFFKVLINDEKRKRFEEYLDSSPVSRELYREWETALTDEDDVRRAAAFFYCACLSIYGNMRGGIIDISYKESGSIVPADRLKQKRAAFDAIRERFRNVSLVNNDFRKIFETFDGPETLFYCDPPYKTANNAKYYAMNFSDDDARDLVDCCLKSKSKIVLSCFDYDAYQPLKDAGWRYKQWERTIGFVKNVVEENERRHFTFRRTAITNWTFNRLSFIMKKGNYLVNRREKSR